MNEDDGFKVWMEKVNHYVIRYCGMDYQDLPDWNYRDAYDDCVAPSRAARSVISAARDY